MASRAWRCVWRWLAAAWVLAIALPAAALSSGVVISQVYGGGGNIGATWRNDFVELFNRGTTSINLAGWSLQYAAATGTTWQVTNLSGTIPPGGYYLIQQGTGGGGTVSLPTPNATGTVNINAISGKVALVNSTTALTGSGCPIAASVIDFVGYGTGGTGANCFEASPAPTLNNTTAALRAANGCTETDNNAGDFAVGAPNPRNSASPVNLCTVPLPSLSVNDVSLNEGNAGTTSFTFTVSLSSPAPVGGVTFDIATQDGTATAGSDYIARALTAQTIPAGNSTYSFTVLVNGDTVVEANETFFVNVTNVTGATVLDGQGQGTIVNDDVAPNLPPVLTVPASIAVVQNVATSITGISLTDPDAGAAIVSITFTAPTGALAATAGGGVAVTGSGTGTLRLDGSIVDLNAFIASGAVTYTTAVNATGSVTLGVTANDNGNTGAGGPQTDSRTITLAIVIPPAITSASSTTFTVASAGTFTVVASGAPAPALSLAGALPSGVSFVPATGVLSGTPALGTVGTYLLTFTAANGVGANATQNFTLTVAKANQTITFANPGTQNFGTPPLTLAPSASSGLPVTLTSTTPAVCTVAGNVVTLVAAGTCTLNANQAGDANYNAAAQVTQTFTVNAVVPGAPTITNATAGDTQTTITFTPPASNGGSAITSYTARCTAGTTTFTASGTASPIIVTGLTNGTTYSCTVSASNVAGTGPPSASVSVTPQPTPVPPAITSASSTTFSVNSAGTFTVVATGTPTPTLSLSGALPNGVTFVPATGVLSGTPALGTVGTYALTFTATNGTLPNATQAFTLVVAKAGQSIAFTNPGDQNFTTTAITLDAIATSGLAVSVTSATPTVCAVTGNQLTLIAAGTCTLDANQAGDANYNAAAQITQTFAVNAVVPGAPTITNATAGDTQTTITFTPPASNGGSAITNYTVTCTAGSTTLSASGAASPITITGLVNGVTYTCSVTATNVAGTGPPSASASVTPQPTPVPPAITSASSTTFTVNSAGTFTVVATGTPAPVLSLAGALPSGVTFVPATGVLSGTPALGTVGTYALTFTAANGALPNATQTFTLTVAKANQTITFANPGTQNFGTPPLTLAPSASSGLPVTLSSTTPTACTVAGNVVTLVAAGTCTLNANQAGDANYNAAAQVTQTFTVNAVVPGAPTITSITPGDARATVAFNPPASNGGSAITNYTVTCTAGASTLSASGTSSPIVVAGLTNGTTYSCSVTATNSAGTGPPSASVSVTPQPTPVPPAITSANSTTFTVNALGSFTVVATGTPTPTLSLSGTLPNGVTFVPATGVLSGTPALGTVGTYALTFTAANGALPNATQNFTLTVAKANQTITFANPGPQNFGAPPITLTPSASSGLAVTLTSATPAVCTIASNVVTLVAAGTCTLNANQAGDANYNAATQVTQSFNVSAVAPGAPTITSVTAGDRQATISFTPPASNGGGAITNYTVTCTAGTSTLSASGTASPITITGLTNGTTYSCTVSATSAAGSSVVSAAATVTPAAAPPPAPIAVPTLSQWTLMLLTLLTGAIGLRVVPRANSRSRDRHVE